MKIRIFLLLGLALFPLFSYGAWESEVLLRVASDDPDKITAALLWSPNIREFFYSKELPRTSKVFVQYIDVKRIAYRFKNDDSCSVSNPGNYVIYATEGYADFYMQADPGHTQSRLIVGTTPLNPCLKGRELKEDFYQEVPRPISN